MALYDLKSEKKLSETFYFDCNEPNPNFPTDPAADPVTLSREALFQVGTRSLLPSAVLKWVRGGAVSCGGVSLVFLPSSVVLVEYRTLGHCAESVFLRSVLSEQRLSRVFVRSCG